MFRPKIRSSNFLRSPLCQCVADCASMLFLSESSACQKADWLLNLPMPRWSEIHSMSTSADENRPPLLRIPARDRLRRDRDLRLVPGARAGTARPRGPRPRRRDAADAAALVDARLDHRLPLSRRLPRNEGAAATRQAPPLVDQEPPRERLVHAPGPPRASAPRARP